MNKVLKSLGFMVFAIALVFVILSVVSATGLLKVTLNSPEDGTTYQLYDDVIINASIFSDSVFGTIYVYASVVLPDGNVVEVPMELNNGFFRSEEHTSELQSH